MARILFWLFVILAIQWLWRQSARRDPAHARRGSDVRQDSTRAREQGRRADGTGGARAAGATGMSAPAEAMVRCVQCGIHAPVSEMRVLDGKHFCCNEHAARYASRPVGRDDAQ